MLKKSLVQPPPILAHPTTDENFILSMDANDTGMGAMLKQGQGEDGRVVTWVKPYA